MYQLKLIILPVAASDNWRSVAANRVRFVFVPQRGLPKDWKIGTRREPQGTVHTIDTTLSLAKDFVSSTNGVTHPSRMSLSYASTDAGVCISTGGGGGGGGGSDCCGGGGSGCCGGRVGGAWDPVRVAFATDPCELNSATSSKREVAASRLLSLARNK